MQGEQAVGGRVSPRAPGVGGAGGGALSRRSARACCYLYPAEACPSPAFPEPQAAGLGGGVCAPLMLAGAFCEVPPPRGPEAGPGQMGSFRPAPGPCNREGRVSIPDPARPFRGKPPSASSSGSQAFPMCVGASQDWLSPRSPLVLAPKISPNTCHLPGEARRPPPPRAEALVPSRACDPVVQGQRMKVKVVPSCQLLPAPGTAQRAVSRCLSHGRRAPGSLRWTLGPVVRWGMGGRGAGVEPGDSVGPQGHSGGTGGRVQAAEHALQARRREQLVGTRCGGWTVGGGLSP